MATTFTLDMIREATEAKYGSLDIPMEDGSVVSLLNPLRLAKGKRDELMEVQKQLSSDEKDEDAPEVDQEATFVRIFELVAATEAQAGKLIAALEGDLAAMAVVFEKYGEDTQAGEASASQD